MSAPFQDPLARFKRWLALARKQGEQLPEAGALATVDGRGCPSLRFVLLKDSNARGFTFYTNAESRKGHQLAANPNASLAFYWHLADRQVRIDGRVRMLSAAEADRYWAQRPRPSQLASLASRQSRPMASRKQLLSELRRLENLYRGRAVPRPERWTGYRLIARQIEFWRRQEPRLHHRELFTLRGRTWSSRLLQP